ncbi:MAG: hypothetical protein J6C13_04045 [Clostridia bacterium]|nr:hypothetical protein [Clostridia bacterium]
MKTGYFGKVRSYPKDKGYRFVSIARFNKFWTGDEFEFLAPPAEIIKIEDGDLYTKLYYEKVLNKLNTQEVYNMLGDNAVLLCYEKWSDIKEGKTFCHRRIVAKWFEDNLGIKVEELSN